MASLWFYGPAEQIEAAWVMADRLARAPHDPCDERTLDQRRFDLAVQVLQGRLTVTDLGDVQTAVDAAPRTAAHPDDTIPTDDATPSRGTNTPAGARIDQALLVDIVEQVLTARPPLHATVHKPLIHVVVGLDTLLGSNRPAELIGHGPLDPLTARALAAGGTWARLVTDPITGRLLDHARTRYNPPTDLADHVRARDQTCRGPGCTRRISELDHHIPYGAGHDGQTSEANLNGYCRSCHRLKDAPGWTVIAGPDHTLTWISPNGHRTTTHPYDYRPFTDPAPDTQSTNGQARPTVGATAGSTNDRAPADDDVPPF